jgi:hypothetical protein
MLFNYIEYKKKQMYESQRPHAKDIELPNPSMSLIHSNNNNNQAF